ncbi:helix-turn-helix domain-containing protein [Streptomyces sp. NPDC006733]|uniref:PucR family transcriptional regulator n=1 Tax=Streptomyces sp. NPDC006733 TaxID=3155460 RepID=UPI0034006F8D
MPTAAVSPIWHQPPGADDHTSQGELELLARLIGEPPQTVQAVAFPALCDDLPLQMAQAGLVDLAGPEPFVLIFNPEHDSRALVERQLRGRIAAVAPVARWAEAATSLRWARSLLTLKTSGRVKGESVVFVDDHLSTLLLFQDETLARQHVSQRLQPLDHLTPRQRQRLEQTLAAWLSAGSATDAAKALRVHPQTVRYRLRRLEALFGPALRDPRTRVDLEIALHNRRLMGPEHRDQETSRARRSRRSQLSTPNTGPEARRVNGL